MTTANNNEEMFVYYIDPSQATKVRVFHDGWTWCIDAADDSGNYTEVCWTHWDEFEMEREDAISHIKDFCEAINRIDLINKTEIEEE